MSSIIDSIDFQELEAERFWSFAKSYKGNKKEETKQMFLSGEYLCSLKVDGHYARLIKDMDGNIRLQGRTKSVSGEYLDKHTFVPQLNDFFAALPNGTCLLGELYFPNQPGSRKVTTILGCLVDKALERQEKGEKLHYYIFDIWAYAGKSYLKTTMEKRIETLKEIAKYKNDYVDIAEYYDGEEAWDKLAEILEAGGEGMVAMKRKSMPEPGKRTARKSLKCKQELSDTIDVFLTGEYKLPVREYKGKTKLEDYIYWENVKTREIFTTNKFNEYTNGQPYEPVSRHYALKFAGSVQIAVMKNGEVFPVGYVSSITDDVREQIIKNPEKFKGRVYELSCMMIECIDGQYSFRHPKFICERPEKTAAECDWSQIIG